MAESVDRLELVSDEEEVVSCNEIDQLALETVRVLELVDEDRAEPEAGPFSNGLVLEEEVAREKLQILEVDRRLALLRAAIRALERAQELLEQSPVASCNGVESRPLDGLEGLGQGVGSRSRVSRGSPRDAELGQVEEGLRLGGLAEGLEGSLRRRARRMIRWKLCQELLGGPPRLSHASIQVRLFPGGQLERQPGRPEPLVYPDEHRGEAPRAVRGEQPQTVGATIRHELAERLGEGLGPDDPRLALVEDPEARVEPGLERVRAQQARAEAVDRRDPGAVDLACEIAPPELTESLADSLLQLPGGSFRVRDHENRSRPETAIARRANVSLDEHRRLARPSTGRDEDDAGLLDCRELLGIDRRRRAHGRSTRHIAQLLHHAGHPSVQRGSWRTSPARIRPTAPRARSTAWSTVPQNASSSR